MKKSLYAMAFLLVIFVGTDVRSQPEWDAVFTGDVVRGSLSGGTDNLLGEDSKTGYSVGGYVQLRADDVYGFAAGLRYTRRGGGGTIDSTFAIVNFKDVIRSIGSADITLDYVEIPLTLVVFGDFTEHSHVRAYVGPSINILVRAHQKGEIDGEPFDVSIKNDLQNMHISGTLGAGYTYSFDNWFLTLDFGYWQGLTKLVDGADIKTRDTSIGLGVGIPLARE